MTPIAAHLDGRTPHFEIEHRMLHRDGSYRWMLTRGLAVRDRTGKAYRMAGSQTDITEGKVADALTGLPNRILFLDRLGRFDRAWPTRAMHGRDYCVRCCSSIWIASSWSTTASGTLLEIGCWSRSRGGWRAACGRAT